MADDGRKLGMRTLSIHGGEKPDPVTRASAPNLVMSTTFVAEPGACFSASCLGEDSPFFYTRWSNPTVEQLETKLSQLEDAEACAVFGSGMAAVSALFLYALSPGDHAVVSDVAYAGTAEITNDLIPALGIRVTKANMSDLDEVRRALTPETKLLFVETPCNPIMRLTDIAAVAAAAREAGAALAVDSTFSTPMATQPISLGADYVIHSLTKYLGGHGDAVGGAVLGRRDQINELRQKVAIRTGGILSPFNAWLIMRGLATFPLRMEAHQRGALHVASFLENHPKVTRVMYPGLPSHPQHELALRQMRNFAGMITFQVRNGSAPVRAIAERLRIIHHAVSLGHHRSLIFYLPTADLLESSFKLTESQLESYREYAGEGIFRLSIGLEDPEDLCRDLEQALEAVE